MTDWLDACDPVPARRELTDAEKRRRRAFLNHHNRQKQWLSPSVDACPTYAVEPVFEDMGA